MLNVACGSMGAVLANVSFRAPDPESGPSAVRQEPPLGANQPNVRFGSKADIRDGRSEVRPLLNRYKEGIELSADPKRSAAKGASHRENAGAGEGNLLQFLIRTKTPKSRGFKECPRRLCYSLV